MKKSVDSAGLVFRQDYFSDRAGWAALVALLREIFDIDIGPLQCLGGPDPTSMPFGWFDPNGTLVANLSAFALPLVVNGRRLNAAALQSGAVRREWRGRGLYRDVTRKALAWCDAKKFEAVALYTDKPSLYLPYGFRTLPLHSYRGAAPEPIGSAAARKLDPLAPGDLALLQEALNTRSPVSNILAVASNAPMFLVNTQLDPDVHLTWLADCNAAVAWKITQCGHFTLLDVVARDIPGLATILGGLRLRPTVAEVLFCPDKLNWQADARPLETGTHFMLRTENEVTLSSPAMLSPMADF